MIPSMHGSEQAKAEDYGDTAVEAEDSERDGETKHQSTRTGSILRGTWAHCKKLDITACI